MSILLFAIMSSDSNRPVFIVLEFQPNEEVIWYPEMSDRHIGLYSVHCTIAYYIFMWEKSAYLLSVVYSHWHDHNLRWCSHISSDSQLHTMEKDTSFHS